MTVDTLGLSAYYQASSLQEREPHSGKAGHLLETTPLANWRQRSLGDDAVYHKYLEAHGLTGAQLARLLSGAVWSPRLSTSAWIDQVEPWLITPPALGVSLPLAAHGIVVEGTLLTSLPFPGLLASIVAHQRSHLDQWPWLSTEARLSLLDGLAARLANISARSLIAELDSRPTTAPASECGRYLALDRWLTTPEGRRSTFGKRPLLARDLITVISDWREHVRRLLDRLTADLEALHSGGHLGADLADLTLVAVGQGDHHDGGQTVTTLSFSSGERLVYKPRNTDIYAAYEHIVQELNNALPSPAKLRAPRCLAGEGYGWVEFIDAAETGVPDLVSYLSRLGALLAVAHVFGASDLHMENVIATSTGPVPIDLETMIQNRSVAVSPQLAGRRAVDLLNASVLGTGMLPIHLKAGEGTTIDVSVVTGGLASDVTAIGHQIKDPGTDAMRIEASLMRVGRSKNQPPNMTWASIHQNRAVIAEGFAHGYRAVQAKKAQLIAILRSHPKIESRHILRPTRAYSLLLTEMCQGQRTTNGLERDALLRTLWGRLAEHPKDVDLVAEEMDALWHLDVPVFTTALNGRTLRARGRDIAYDYFEMTTLDHLESRLNSLSEASLRESQRLIHESVIAASPTSEVPPATSPRPENSTPDSDIEVTDLARSQAQLLDNHAIRGEDDVTWVSICSSEDGTGLEYRPLGPTLYDGLAGVGFAATYAHLAYPEMGLADLARRTMRATSAILTDWIRGRVKLPLGAFSGAAGLLYSLAHYDQMLGDNTYARLRVEAIEHFSRVASDDIYFDVMAGAAGACAVIAADRTAPSETRSRSLRALAKHLVTSAVTTDDGSMAWETGQARVRLGGFSHGATGIGWALARTAGVLGDAELASAARRALKFDDGLFHSEHQAWLDRRPESVEQGDSFPRHWCHGSAGIAMARRDASTYLPTTDVVTLAEIGAQGTFAAPLPADDSLCHGSLGNLMALGDFADTAAFADYQARILRRFRATSGTDAIRYGLRDGITSVRGLMLGTAGAAYALAWIRDPALPRVLLLEPPPA